MISFTQVNFKALAVHRVGNKLRGEGMLIAPELYDLEDEQLRTLLMDYFLIPFKQDETYRFAHDSDLALNELYNYCSAIFDHPKSLYEQSVHIARHLYNQSSHPKIQSGELYIAYFTDCQLDDELTDAIGIFKSENKDIYLKPSDQSGQLHLSYEHGINIRKLDKGCLIFNTDGDNGFRVAMVDKLAKNNEAQYWKDDFLRIERVHDRSFTTQNVIELCQEFSDEIFTTDETRKDQIVFMSKSLNYFAEHDSFDLEEFATEVIEQPERIKEFKQFKEDFESHRQFEAGNEFRISQPAVKAMKRKFKSLIQLDTAIDIKLKSDLTEQYVERGYDEKRQMYFYKLYFREEV
ncbi:MAG: nucleoid-associated protein [Sphingobacteriales bacterium]|nr:nucleoid-associated protein [Sphingobacteriales bacterium]MCC7222368.1 nucleoid-associated protein [Chitinophagales bacterium]